MLVTKRIHKLLSRKKLRVFGLFFLLSFSFLLLTKLSQDYTHTVKFAIDKINIPEDIPLLGIKKGKQKFQRFFYWNICKLFYKPDFSIEEMNHINFDWFRPMNCYRHTKAEVINFCENAELLIEHINIQNSGITVVARKKEGNL